MEEKKFKFIELPEDENTLNESEKRVLFGGTNYSSESTPCPLGINETYCNIYYFSCCGEGGVYVCEEYYGD